MPNCTSCGRPLAGADRFCNSCGAAQAPPLPPLSAPAGPPPPVVPARTPFPGWAVALIVLVGVAVLGAVATFVVSFVLPLVMIGSVISSMDAWSTSSPTPADSRETAVVDGVLDIQVGIEDWAVDHGDTYPPGSVATPDGLRDYVAVWPVNPFSGGPMLPADEGGAPNVPGGYLYLRHDDRSGYELTAFGAGGEPIPIVP